jgi:hypothetical protein
MREIVLNFNLSNNIIPSDPLSFLKSAFEESCPSPVHHYLLACQTIQISLMSRAKCALLHHDLVLSAELIQKRQLLRTCATCCLLKLLNLPRDIHYRHLTEVLGKEQDGGRCDPSLIQEGVRIAQAAESVFLQDVRISNGQAGN